eukprot:4076224-Amphidinium_carterae.4
MPTVLPGGKTGDGAQHYQPQSATQLHTHLHTHSLPQSVFSSLAHATREGVKSIGVVPDTVRNGSLDMEAGIASAGRSFATEWVYPTHEQAQGAVRKDFDALTENDFIEHAEALHRSRLEEVTKLFKLSCFRRLPRSECTNLPGDTGRVIKYRITLRGFKDLGRSVNTWAATAARNAQKTLNSLAMTQSSWDISSAFAQGMTFQEIATATGEEQRSIQLEVAPHDLDWIRSQPGFEDFSCHQEVLDLLKPVYGLRDAQVLAIAATSP